MSDELITVATFNFSTDPNFLLFKAALKHYDIPFFAADENTVNANPFLSISVGGIRVMVHEDDVPAATGIWREINESASSEEDTVFAEAEDSKVKPFNINPKGNPAYFMIVVALVSFLLLTLALVILKIV